MNPRQLLVTAYAVRLLLQGRDGDAVVAEVRDWNGPKQSTYRRAAAIVAGAVVGLALLAAADRGPARVPTELATLHSTR